MAWQAYIDQNLMGTKDVISAAILAFDGTVKAKSTAFPELKPGEFDDIMKKVAQLDLAITSPLRIGGISYMVISREDGITIHADKGRIGVCIVKTKQSVVIGIYVEATYSCSAAIQVFGNYLISEGW